MGHRPKPMPRKLKSWQKKISKQCSNLATGDTGCPLPLPDNHPTFEFPCISEQTGLKLLLTLPICKSTSCRYITNRVLRETAPVITQSLTWLYNLSIKTGTFPREWKSALVTPIYKQKGQPQHPTNYRPISLLPAVGKVFDAIQSRHLLSYLIKHRLITEHQFGFVPGKSTTHQMLCIVDDWLQALDDGKGIAAVFMDFQKAFDRVWHDGLLYKLGLCGIKPAALSWVRSYLTDRSISVQVRQHRSSPYPLSAGVPQGSHLGPVLFIVFINDLPTTTGSPTELYADDALLYGALHKPTAGTPQTDLANLQVAITNASSWAQSWHGTFSPVKTIVLPIGSVGITACGATSLLMDDVSISVADNHKHLGVTFSSDLTWRKHLNSVLLKGKQKAGLIRHMCHDLTPDIASKIYLFYLRPLLEYACPVWHASLTADQALSLERIQASVARSILRAEWHTPKDQLLQTLKWPSLRWRRTILCVTLLHNLLYTSPAPIKSHLFPFSSQRSQRNLRKPQQLIIQHAGSTRRLKSFFHHTAFLWNSLPRQIQEITSKSKFKTAVEEHWALHKYDTNKDIPFE